MVYFWNLCFFRKRKSSYTITGLIYVSNELRYISYYINKSHRLINVSLPKLRYFCSRSNLHTLFDFKRIYLQNL